MANQKFTLRNVKPNRPYRCAFFSLQKTKHTLEKYPDASKTPFLDV